MAEYIIIGREDCVWCEKAKALIEAEGDAYAYYDYKEHPLIKHFMKMFGWKTVPQIMLKDGHYIGGYTDLLDDYNSESGTKV